VNFLQQVKIYNKLSKHLIPNSITFYSIVAWSLALGGPQGAGHCVSLGRSLGYFIVKFGITFLIFIVSFTVEARIFSNAYISFKIPDSWTCSPDQSEWICRSIRDPSSKEAVVILAAKEVGPLDKYDLYQQHLNIPIPNSLGAGGGRSKVMYQAKSVQINNQKWLDSLHFESEIQNYYTRYLAAIKSNRVAIVVTFSAHREVYAKYSQDFFNIVNSLKILASDSPKILQPPSLIWGPNIGNGLYPTDPKIDLPTIVESGNGKNRRLLFGITLILIAIIGFLLLRSKKEK